MDIHSLSRNRSQHHLILKHQMLDTHAASASDQWKDSSLLQIAYTTAPEQERPYRFETMSYSAPSDFDESLYWSPGDYNKYNDRVPWLSQESQSGHTTLSPW